jgi:hypothetical protein
MSGKSGKFHAIGLVRAVADPEIAFRVDAESALIVRSPPPK